mmetsp:Transcript_56696/g.101065  ORF Transcript_56696/g.101065 Transcript_56696/m.101065 type:complete len:103 (+) Transcript_56696:1643-1951(+)
MAAFLAMAGCEQPHPAPCFCVNEHPWYLAQSKPSARLLYTTHCWPLRPAEVQGQHSHCVQVNWHPRGSCSYIFISFGTGAIFTLNAPTPFPYPAWGPMRHTR